MSRGVVFVELEQKVEQLVNRYSHIKDENDALKREVGFLRQENQRLQTEQKEIEDKVARIVRRVQIQDDHLPAPSEQDSLNDEGNMGDDDFVADAKRYETPGS